jgi:hypothetical protein
MQPFRSSSISPQTSSRVRLPIRRKEINHANLHHQIGIKQNEGKIKKSKRQLIRSKAPVKDDPRIPSNRRSRALAA